MSRTEDYRTWTRSVRSDARSQLLQLRQDRAAKRKPNTTAPASTTAPAALPLSVSRQTASFMDRPVAPREDTAPVETSAEPQIPFETAPKPDQAEPDQAEVMSEAVQDPAPIEAPEESTALDGAQMEPPAHAENFAHADAHDTPPSPASETVTKDDLPADLSAPEPDSSEPAPAPLIWDETTLRASDLCRLPGIGIGLVWLLHANGITTLADLAKADAAQLSSQLGLVGQLIDLDVWIATAQDHGT